MDKTQSVMAINSLRPRQHGSHFADDTFKPIFLNENIRISIKILLKFVPKVPINNIPALVQIMAWRQPGDKPLSEPMMVCLLTHVCVTRPQWVNGCSYLLHDSIPLVVCWPWPSSWNLASVRFYPILSLKLVRMITHHLLKLGSPNLTRGAKQLP